MKPIAAEQYAEIGPLFEPLRYNLVIDSVLEGNTPGWVYADRAAAPRTGLIWDRQDAVLVAGKENEALWSIIQDEIIPDARKRWIPELSISYPDEDWAAAIMVRLAAFRPEKTGRRYYRFDTLRSSWRELLPDGYGLRRIDPSLLDSEDIFNADQMAGWVRSFWASDEDFVRKGFGYCAMTEDTIASWCLTVFASRDQRELAVGTAADQRGKGLATAVAAASVEHCLSNGFQPHWHCLDENTASWKVAEKIGFSDPVPYQVVRIHL